MNYVGIREDLSRPVPIIEKGNQTFQDDSLQPQRRNTSYYDAQDCVPQNFEKSFAAATQVDLTKDSCDVSASSSQIDLPDRSDKSARTNRTIRSDSSLIDTLKKVVKETVQSEFRSNIAQQLTSAQVPTPQPVRKKRGRPPKNENNVEDESTLYDSDSTIQLL